MDRTTLLHSLDQLNDKSPTASLCSRHRAMGSASTRMELFYKTNILPMHLQHLRLAVAFVTVQTHQVYLLECPME